LLLINTLFCPFAAFYTIFLTEKILNPPSLGEKHLFYDNFKAKKGLFEEFTPVLS